MYRSIFSRLFKINFLSIIIALLSMMMAMVGFFTYYAEQEQYDLYVKTATSIEYSTIMLQIENNNFHSRSLYERNLNSWAEFTNSDITVVNFKGDIISSTADIKNVPPYFLEKVLSDGTKTRKDTFGNNFKKRVYTVGVPFYFQNRVAGAIFFSSPLPFMSKDISGLIRMLLYSCLVSLIIAFISVYFQAKYISTPIKDINKAVNYIASGKFDKRVKVSSNDEIGQLASSFNYMAERLSHLNNKHSEFISDISHELRTPMTSISGFVGGILDGTIPPEQQNEYLKLVYDESIRLTKLTNDMLEMTKLSSSEYKLNATEFDINETIRRCIIQLEQRITDKNLELEINFEPDIIRVVGDMDAIWRVVLNILDNAIKFSFNNTKIIISTWFKDEKAYVSIGNFGTGIEANDIPHIFDRFYKTDKSRANDKKGAGLGLSMVKNIISLHKEQIWVDSTETKAGTGVKFTKFTFTLKLK